MKPKIKFRLERWGRTLVFQVLEMDERFRYRGPWCPDDHKSYECYNSVIIWSAGGPDITLAGSPDLALGEVFLWGTKTDLDDAVVKRSFSTVEDAKKHEVRILDALKDWSENWDGWIEDNKSEKEPGVYEF